MDETRHLMREYYRKAELWLPENPSHRQFKFIINGVVVSVRDRIKDERTLRKWLVKLVPDHAYYSLSHWLEPTEISSRVLDKPGYVSLGNAVIGHDFAFDIDAPSLEKAKLATLEIMDYLDAYGYESEVRFSGKKGFHVFLPSFKFDIAENIRNRQGLILDQKADLINGMQQANLDFDVQISLDLRRVIRIPQTIHGDSMNLCEIIKRSQLHAFIPTHFTDMMLDKIMGSASPSEAIMAANCR